MDEINNFDETDLAEDEYIEEEVDVEEIANSNRTLINAMISLLVEKGIFTEQEILERASSEDLPDYDVQSQNDEE